jgi:hypothetical protein
MALLGLTGIFWNLGGISAANHSTAIWVKPLHGGHSRG